MIQVKGINQSQLRQRNYDGKEHIDPLVQPLIYFTYVVYTCKLISQSVLYFSKSSETIHLDKHGHNAMTVGLDKWINS